MFSGDCGFKRYNRQITLGRSRWRKVNVNSCFRIGNRILGNEIESCVDWVWMRMTMCRLTILVELYRQHVLEFQGDGRIVW